MLSGRRTLSRCDGNGRLFGGGTPNVNFALARADAGADNVGQKFYIFIEGLHAQIFKRFAPQSRDRNRNVLQALGAFGGGYHHFLELRLNRARNKRQQRDAQGGG